MIFIFDISLLIKNLPDWLSANNACLYHKSTYISYIFQFAFFDWINIGIDIKKNTNAISIIVRSNSVYIFAQKEYSRTFYINVLIE